MLKGYKTYIISGCLAIIAVLRMLDGDSVPLMELIKSPDFLLLLEALGFSALRAGIAKSS